MLHENRLPFIGIIRYIRVRVISSVFFCLFLSSYIYKFVQCQPSVCPILCNRLCYAQKSCRSDDWFTRCIFILSSCWICLKINWKRREQRFNLMRTFTHMHVCARHSYVVFLIRCHQSRGMLKSVEISCFLWCIHHFTHLFLAPKAHHHTNRLTWFDLLKGYPWYTVSDFYSFFVL